MGNEIVPITPGEFLIYQTGDGRTRVQVRVEQETVWLTQKQMAELFQKDVRTINEHIRNIFVEGELPRESVIRNFRITAVDGKQYDAQHYNLDVIISVGYRVRSLRGTQFRIWATQRLREYIVKGFTLDDERLKAAGGADYFDELLARIRDIRSSERVFWRKILDIYATSIDYDPAAAASRLFFQTMQNTLTARYSSLSSGSAPWDCSAASRVWCSSNASEMYFRKMRPRTTCLYSAASMLDRSASAASHRCFSKPSTAPLFCFAMLTSHQRYITVWRDICLSQR